MDAESVLLSVLASLVGALIFVVKSVMAHSDKQATARDKHLGTMVQMLEQSVSSFRAFEAEEHQFHTSIVKTQQEILQSLERLADRIDSKR